MPSPSNIYAEKIFSEHPIAAWSLDDKADYVSLLPSNSIISWSIEGGEKTSVSLKDVPFPDEDVIKVSPTEASFGDAISITSPNLYAFDQLNKKLATFSIGTYVYSDSSYIDSYEIGYEYFDDLSGQTVQKTKVFQTSVIGRWIFISETFDVPDLDYEFRAILKINYFSDAVVFNEEDFIFYVNGISFGQWSEEFASTSTGVTTTTVPNSVALVGGNGAVEARQYGFSDGSGYYLISDNALVAKNSGVPLVYGAKNNTVLSSNNNLPSLIVPGHGFLNNSGKYLSYTFEFWARIESNVVGARRIVGPIASSDGIYVDGPFVVLSIGKYSQSYYVGEWSRPMLFDLRYSNSSASLLINGEQVISIPLDLDEITFVSEYSEDEKNQDWIGFYAYDDVSPIEIDCVAIYPYQVSNILAKRRWIYGQAVEFPENINAAYSGTSFFIDYPFAKYSNNYNYPDVARWQSGVLENIAIKNNTLSSPEYDLPEIVLNSKTLDEWKSALAASQNEFDSFIKLKFSDSSWNGEEPYIYFPKLNVLSQSVKAVYGIFKVNPSDSGTHPLIKIDNPESGNSFMIAISGASLSYYMIEDGITRIVYQKARPADGEMFVAGFDIDLLSDYFGSRVATFFGDMDKLRMYVGGDSESESFTGNIYQISFCNDRNLSKIAGLFGETGIAGDYSDLETYIQSVGPELTIYDAIDAGLLSNTRWSFLEKIYDGGVLSSYVLSEFTSHTPSYSFFLNKTIASFDLDIAAESYWEDYVPLSYLAKYVNDSSGNSVYGIDFIQFNIDYPVPSLFLEQESESSWTYEELQAAYSNPVVRGYEYLDNELFTGYGNYIDLKNKSVKSYRYNTTDSMVRTYVSFQYLSSGSNASYHNFNTIKLPPKNNVIQVGKDGEDWLRTKYEVVDNMIIYPPQDVDFNLIAMVVHVEMSCFGINNSPIRIRSLQLASQSLEYSAPTPVGTRFGNNIYPYKKAGVYFNYKATNPFAIYKGSTPYLYLTKKSGIEVVGDFNKFESRGISMPINQSLASSYKVIAMQAAIRFGQDFFPFDAVEVFEIQSKDAYIKFYLKSIHPNGKRARIYAVNAKTGRVENGIAFYINGNIVKDPVITTKEWAFLGINFASTLNFDNYAGAIRITGPLLFNNISHYQSTNLQEVQQVSVRPWFKVRRAGSLDLDWQYWDSGFIWNGVLVIASTSYYGINPSDIYKMYTGTNKIIIDDNYQIRFGDYQYSVYSDVAWQSEISSAV